LKPTRGTLAWYEKKAIQNALTKSSGNRKNAAVLLDVGEATIYRKIKKYHIKA
jgi:transcriptional regulator with PAS, ATPase and Fis domain